MKMTIIACLFFLTTGCATISQLGPHRTDRQTEQFHNALDLLFKKSDSGPLKAYIKQYPDSSAADDANKILQLFNSNISYKTKLKACNQQSITSKQELEKLQADIERLTQLHLKMGQQ